MPKNFLLYLLICLSLISCVSITEDANRVVSDAADIKKPVLDIYKVKVGMTEQEVKAILKEELVIGYKVDGIPEKLQPITIRQPYREETFLKDGKTFHVLYYYSSVVRPDDLVAEDELTPLIFENNSLVGKGLADLDHIKRM